MPGPTEAQSPGGMETPTLVGVRAPRPDEVNIPLDALRPMTVDEGQPRTSFDEQKIADLASSIAKEGIIEPLRIFPDSSKPGHFVILAGESRFRAAKSTKPPQVTVPCRIVADPGSPAARTLDQLVNNEARSSLGLFDLGQAVSLLLNGGQTIPDISRSTTVAEIRLNNAVLCARFLHPSLATVVNLSQITEASAIGLARLAEKESASPSSSLAAAQEFQRGIVPRLRDKSQQQQASTEIAARWSRFSEPEAARAVSGTGSHATLKAKVGSAIAQGNGQGAETKHPSTTEGKKRGETTAGSAGESSRAGNLIRRSQQTPTSSPVASLSTEGLDDSATTTSSTADESSVKSGPNLVLEVGDFIFSVRTKSGAPVEKGDALAEAVTQLYDLTNSSN